MNTEITVEVAFVSSSGSNSQNRYQPSNLTMSFSAMPEQTEGKFKPVTHWVKLKILSLSGCPYQEHEGNSGSWLEEILLGSSVHWTPATKNPQSLNSLSPLPHRDWSALAVCCHRENQILNNVRHSHRYRAFTLWRPPFSVHPSSEYWKGEAWGRWSICPCASRIERWGTFVAHWSFESYSRRRGQRSSHVHRWSRRCLFGTALSSSSHCCR